MVVRAKFKVYSKTPMYDSNKEIEGYHIYMSPVYDSNPNSENGVFYKYTPGGSIMLSTINTGAASQFEVSKEYYVDFTPA